MINNYFQDEQYHPSDPVYQHPLYHNFLHIGDMSAAIDVPYLHKNRIKTVITAAAGMEHIEYDQQDDIEHIVYSLLDIKSENIQKHFNSVHEILEHGLSKGGVLVHCAAGISRSATLVIAYIMRQKQWSFREAIAFVRKNRLKVCPNLGFERQLKQYEQIIMKHKYQIITRRGSKTSQQPKHASKHIKKIQLPQIGSLGRTQIKSIILNPFLEKEKILSRAASRSYKDERTKRFEQDLSYKLKPIKLTRKTKSMVQREKQQIRPQRQIRIPNINLDLGAHSVVVRRAPFAESKTQRLIRKRPLNRFPIANYPL